MAALNSLQWLLPPGPPRFPRWANGCSVVQRCCGRGCGYQEDV